MSLKLAIFAAELTLKNYEKEYPDDPRPRQAIEAARKVLKADTAQNRLAAHVAADAAHAAYMAAGAAHAADVAANVAADAADVAAHAAHAAYVAYVAADVAYVAADAAARNKILSQCHNYIVKNLILEGEK